MLASLLNSMIDRACTSCPQLEEECRLFYSLLESIEEVEDAPLVEAIATLVAALAGAARKAGCGVDATILYDASEILRRASAA